MATLGPVRVLVECVVCEQQGPGTLDQETETAKPDRHADSRGLSCDGRFFGSTDFEPLEDSDG